MGFKSIFLKRGDGRWSKLFSTTLFSILSILILCNFKATAQNYPVQVSVVTSGPFYNYLSYYADANKHLQFIVTLTDFNSGPVNVRLRLKMTGNGYSLQTNPSFPVGPIITLTPGIPVFVSGDDLLPYFQSNNLVKTPSNLNLNSLPFGLTTFCAEAVKVGVGNEILATNNCSSFLLNSFQPAISTQPWCSGNIDPATNPFITFQWTQPIGYTPSIGNDLTYKFRLYEWLDTTNFSIFQGSQGLVYEEITTVPLVNFSTFSYPLQVGKKYIWRTQAQVTSNGILVNMFDNQGFSAPCSFRYGQAISLEAQLTAGLQIDLTASANTPIRGKAQWTVTQTNPSAGGLSTYSSYLLDYRKKPTGNETYTIQWFTDSTAQSFLDIYQLQDSTTYEVKIRGRVGSFISPYSNVVEFTTPPKRIYACGEGDVPLLPAIYNPLLTANPGMTVQIGQFELTFNQISPTGTPGHYAGKGLIPIDFIGGAKAKVSFTDLKIDDQFIVHSGTAEVISDGLDVWLDQQYMQFVDPFYVTGTIESAYVDTVAGLAWIVINGVSQSFVFNPPNYPIIIRDDSGMEYIMYPDGSIEINSYLEISNDNLDVGAGSVIVFQQNDNETFGFDGFEHMPWHEQYEIIQLPDTTNYFVATKSIGVNTTDVVDFTFDSIIWNASNFSYTLDGSTITPSISTNGNKITLTIPSISNKGTSKLYVLSGNQKIGKLNLAVYEEKIKEVVIVPLVANYAFSKTEIENVLKQTIGEANITTNVTLAPQWNDLLFTTSKAIDVPTEVGLLNKYSDEMRDLRYAYFDDTAAVYKEKAYYLFVVPSFLDANLDGYMVRGKGLGFVSNGTTLMTYAHELGHGLGALNHSWKDNGPEEGSTNNLMDYSSNAKELTLNQWKELRDMDISPSFWDNQSSGNYYSINLTYLEPLSNPNSFTFSDPTGNLISIPKSATCVQFSSLDRFVYNFSGNESDILGPIGSILSFDLDGKNYAFVGNSFYERNGMGQVLPIPSAKYTDTLTQFDNPPRVITSFLTSSSTELKTVYFLTDTSNLVSTNDSWIIFDNGSIPLSSSLSSFVNHFSSPGTSKIEKTLTSENFGVDAEPLMVFNNALDTAIAITPFTIFEVSPATTSVEYLVKYLLLCNYKKNDFTVFSQCIQENMWNILPSDFNSIMACSSCVNLNRTNYTVSSSSIRNYFQESLDAAFDMSDLSKFNELIPITQNGTLAEIKEWIKTKPACLIRFMPSPLRAKTFCKLITNDSYWNTALYLLKYFNTDDINLVNEFINNLTSNTFGDWLQTAYPQLSEFWEPDGSDFHKLKEIFNELAIVSASSPSNSHFTNTTFTKNIYRTTNPLTETPASITYTALDQPIFFTKSMTSSIGSSLDAITIHMPVYSGNDGLNVSYSNGKINVQQTYETWDASLSIGNPEIPKTKLSYSVNYELNPYENVTVQFLDNYATELGFDKGESVVVPAYFLKLYKESIAHSNWHSNFRLIGNIAMVSAAVVSSPLTLGGSLTILGGLVAANDIDIQADKQNASVAEIEALNDWETFYSMSMLITAAPSVYNILKSVAAPNRLMRLQLAYTKGYNSLTKIPTTVKNSLVKIRDVFVGGGQTLNSIRTNWLANLHSQYNINDLFVPQGMNPSTIALSLKNEMLSGFSTALPITTKQNFFNTLIRSGSSVPIKKTFVVGDELYKIVPKGNGYSQSSFYINLQEFNILKNSVDIEQKLGLPLGSHAVEYHVYKAVANQSVDVFESTVANTIQGSYTTTGGASQTFLLDDSKWTITLQPNALIPPK